MANTVYNNKVLESKAKDLLTTAVNTRSMMTVDTSLVESAGMTKTINVYEYSGVADEVAEGEGNSHRGSIKYTGKEYKVKVVQQVFDYTDEDEKKDPLIVDMMMKGATQVMANKMTADFIAEAKKATLSHTLVGKISYDNIVDAIAKLNVEDESKLFILIPNAWKADIRKDPDYKAAHMGDVVYNGQVGTVSGLPVVPTKALTDTAFVMDDTAIKLFMAKAVEVEPDRNPDTRTNSIYLRDSYLVALVDNTKICKIAAGK